MTWSTEEGVHRLPVRATVPGNRTERAWAEAPDSFEPLVLRSIDGSTDGVARGWRGTGSITDAKEAWQHWAGRFDRTGLWPLLERGWADRAVVHDEVSQLAMATDVSAVLREGWAGTRRVRPDGTLLPHPPWPGLAAGSDGPPADGVIMELPWPDVCGELLLVHAHRPADTLAQLGWDGACNWSLTGSDVAAVVRSWEDRFGAFVVAVGYADLDLVVTRPPVDEEQSLPLAYEHFAFCPDNFFPQVLDGPTSISPDDYGGSLIGARHWHFWWD